MAITEAPGAPNATPDRGRETRGATRTTPDRTIPHREPQPPEVVSPRRSPGTVDDRRGSSTAVPAPYREEDIPRRGFLTGRWGRRGENTASAVAGLAAGVGTLIAEGRLPENQQRDPSIRFFGADHYNTDATRDENREPQADLRAGNLARNAWEPDPDILRYFGHFRPQVVYADRASLSSPKLDYYYALPSLREWQPQAVYNGRRGAFVISGDNPQSALLVEAKVFDQLAQRIDDRERQAMDRDQMSIPAVVDLVSAGLLTAASATGAVMSRRFFIGGTALLAGLAALEGNKALSAFFRSSQNRWIEGRDALASAKTEDGLTMLRQAHLIPGLDQEPNQTHAILMGNDHGKRISEFMSRGGTASRDRAIYDFAQRSVSLILDVLQEEYQRRLTQQEIGFTTERILNNFASMQIAHVSTPETSARIRASELDSYVANHVQYVFDKPLVSQQVIGAIRPLFPSGANPRTSVPQAASSK